MHSESCERLGVKSYEEFCLAQPTLHTCTTMAKSPTPWLICEHCISQFAVDRGQASFYARKWWQSDGEFAPPSGPASLSDIDMGDGRRWATGEQFFDRNLKGGEALVPGGQILRDLFENADVVFQDPSPASINRPPKEEKKRWWQIWKHARKRN
jgi:hypothetical protein